MSSGTIGRRKTSHPPVDTHARARQSHATNQSAVWLLGSQGFQGRTVRQRELQIAAAQAMFRAYGLYGHIQANRLRSGLLLAGFVALLHALSFSLLLIWSASLGGTLDAILAGAVRQFARSWPLAMAAALAWFGVAYFVHQSLISRATGARGIGRAEAPRLYTVLENLCISRGLTLPALQIIETPALNAYASGLRQGHYVVTVTRGLVDRLADDELEAVLGHELTHIRNWW
jgi:heat shock protein HtpX